MWVTNQGGWLTGTTGNTNKYFDFNFPLSFQNKAYAVIPYDTIGTSNPIEVASVAFLTWAYADTVNTRVKSRIVSDKAFDSATGGFSYIAIGS